MRSLLKVWHTSADPLGGLPSRTAYSLQEAARCLAVRDLSVAASVRLLASMRLARLDADGVAAAVRSLGPPVMSATVSPEGLTLVFDGTTVLVPARILDADLEHALLTAEVMAA